MLKILQATIIPVLLCSNLLGNNYGVEKWPTLLGKSIKFNMTSKEVSSAMKKKGFKLHGSETNPKSIGGESLMGFYCYKGRFAGSNAVVRLEFKNDKLDYMGIHLGFTEHFEASYLKKPITARPHSRPLQTALKLRDSMEKQYGEPSKAVFRQGSNSVSKTEALSERFEKINYIVEYETKGGTWYMGIEADNRGNLNVGAGSPRWVQELKLNTRRN